jgi:hypothetical protein
MRILPRPALALCMLALAACETHNDLALKIGAPPEKATELRSFQVRRYERANDIALLAAATATLQDLGFTVTESAPAAGVLVGLKHRDATEAGQVAAQVVLTVAAAILGVYHNPTWDESQEIHVTVVTSPVATGPARDVRVSFDRYITNNQKHLWKTELVTDREIYREFFDRFDNALSLERNG